MEHKPSSFRAMFRHRFQPGDRGHDVPVIVVNLKLRPTILNMKPGHASSRTPSRWRLGSRRDGRCRGYRAYLWIVPAKGTRPLAVQRSGGCIRTHLQSNLSKTSATASGAGLASNVSESRLNGAEVAFTLTEYEWTCAALLHRERRQHAGRPKLRSAEMPWTAKRKG